MKISAVLLKYKRPKELEEVKKHLAGFDFIDEILVCDNSVGSNIINYGRYQFAANAKNEFIYTQDDDCIIENLRDIYDEFVRHEGKKLINGMKPERMKFYQDKDSLVGWGAFFRKGWANCLDEYIAVYGKDRLFYRETDRIFTMLAPAERVTVAAKVKDFPSAMAPYALSLQGEHETRKAEALGRCRLLLKERVAA